MNQQETNDTQEDVEYFTLIDNRTGTRHDLPVINGTEGSSALDVRKLYQKTGMFTYDPGFMSTASCDSQITFIDGDKGILLYRGYAIEDLASRSDFMEVCYLLLHGDLPTAEEKADFEYNITHHTMLHDQLISLYHGFVRSAHPMAIMVGVVGALSAFYHDSTDINDPHQRMVASHRMIAKMPTIGAYAYKYAIGQPFVCPDNTCSYSENLLRMMFSVPAENYVSNPILSKAMDRILILHADHEQNASTSTVRLAGSSGANPFACVSSGITSLWGPFHGGANEAVIQMLEEIGDKSRIAEFIDRAKNPQDPFRLMGFGHRVYKNYDPRAKILKESCHDVIQELGIVNDPLLDIAIELEHIALNDDYFIEKKLYPNVDFYSGIILKAMGFPTNMFTVIFAIGRTVGWLAHWKEMIGGDDHRIARPRQIYTGERKREFTAAEVRSEHSTSWGRLWGQGRRD